jgi:hypothetical protein
MNETEIKGLIRAPIEHELRTWPHAYDAVAANLKPWEYRLADRDYRVGDTLWLRKWSPTDGYWGESLRRTVIFILEGGAFGIPSGYCIMSLDARSTPVGVPVPEGGERALEEALVDAIIKAYHTTRLAGPAAPHVLSKHYVRTALSNLKPTPPATPQGGAGDADARVEGAGR